MGRVMMLLKVLIFILATCFFVAESAVGRRHVHRPKQTTKANGKLTIPLKKYMSNEDPRTKSYISIEYYAHLKIYTQTFRVILDTSTDEIWVPSWDGKDGNLHYKDPQGYLINPGQQSLGEKELDYRGTRLSGPVYEDEFVLSDTDSTGQPEEIKWNQDFLAVTSANNSNFKKRAFDGVIGLSAVGTRESKSNSVGIKNMFHTIYPGEYNGAKGTDHHLKFSFWFSDKEDYTQDVEQSGGEFTIGGVNENRFTGDIKTHPIIGEDWRLNLTNVWSGNKFVSDTPREAKFMPAMHFIYGPDKEVELILNDLNAKHNKRKDLMMVDCAKMKSYPDLTFVFGGAEYIISSANYITGVKHPTLGWYCYANIRTIPGLTEWLLGRSFLGAFYTVYDSYYGEIGIATRKPDS